MEFSLNEEGFERVREQLAALEADIRKKANLAGLREIAKPLKADLQRSLPIEQGSLRAGIGYKTLSKSRKSAIGIDEDEALEVGATRRASDGGKTRYQLYKLRFLNYGAKPHLIRAKKSKMLALKGGRFAKQVKHPGIKGRNYLQNVLEKNQPHMQSLFVKGVHAVLSKHGVELVA